MGGVRLEVYKGHVMLQIYYLNRDDTTTMLGNPVSAKRYYTRYYQSPSAGFERPVWGELPE